MKAMILAAGLGTRLKPLTNSKPKALVDINGTPLLEHVINFIISYDIRDIIINVHHFADQITDFLAEKNNFGINIQISDEREELLDTGGGLKKAAWFFDKNEAFLVYNVDILSNIDLSSLIASHDNSNALATLAVKDRETTRQLLFDEENKLCEWRNVQTGERKISRQGVGKLRPLAFSGIYILNPKIFNLIHETGVFSIMDVFLRLAKENDIKAYNHSYSHWYDLGRIENVNKYNKAKDIELLD